MTADINISSNLILANTYGRNLANNLFIYKISGRLKLHTLYNYNIFNIDEAHIIL